ncbi:hypothetical protein HU200_053147 [Digitaria exilis]|uniref:Bromo domain-containing protein n=1 Tax=Digitaria exilis TaxID=1010633 RepID=A0A835AS63_9POAL|nr:hypothetical protein HU200_053147 [Digitaria exilis]
MPGSDTAPDAAAKAAFKNVPRRPGNDQDPAGGDGPADVAPPPASLSCNKKRPLVDRGVPEQFVHRRSEKRHRVLPTEQDAKNGGRGGGDATPAPSRKPEAAAAAAASASTSTERPVDWAEERIRKGKMPAVNASPPDQTSGDDERRHGESGGGKLLGDAIRSYRATGAAATGLEIKPLRISKSKSKSKKRKDRGPPFWCGMGRDCQSTSAAGSDLNYAFTNLVTDELRAALGQLAIAAAPVRVYGRMLAGCDRSKHQSRMQMSCKSWLRRGSGRGEFPLVAFLTESEKKAAHGGHGLAVEAYDRRGVAYDIIVKYLASNRSYRLTHEWGRFLKENGLVVAEVPGPKDVMVDLWLFRPPGGKVGMVIMHYFKGDAAHADAAFDEEEERENRARRLDNDDATPAAAAAMAASPPEPEERRGGKEAVVDGVAGGGDEDEKGRLGLGNAGVKGDVAASSELDGGGTAASEEQAGGAPSEVVVVAAPFSPDADATKADEKEATQSSLDATAGGGAAKAVEETEASTPTTGAAAAQVSATTAAGGVAKAVGEEAAVGPGEEAGVRPSPPDDGGGAKKAFGATALSLRFGLNERNHRSSRAAASPQPTTRTKRRRRSRSRRTLSRCGWLFYSFHIDDVPAGSVLHKCVVHFIPQHKQIPSRKQHPGFIVQKVYDLVEEKLWNLTDKDYEDNKQQEIDMLVKKTIDRIGQLPDLEPEETPIDNTDQLSNKQGLRKRPVNPIDVTREPPVGNSEQFMKAETPGSDKLRNYAILVKYRALNGDHYRDKWLDKLVECIPLASKDNAGASHADPDAAAEGSTNGSSSVDVNSAENEKYPPEVVVPIMAALESSAFEALGNDYAKYNQKLRQLLFNIKCITKPLRRNAYIHTLLITFQVGLTSAERTSEPEESRQLQVHICSKLSNQ